MVTLTAVRDGRGRPFTRKTIGPCASAFSGSRGRLSVLSLQPSRVTSRRTLAELPPRIRYLRTVMAMFVGSPCWEQCDRPYRVGPGGIEPLANHHTIVAAVLQTAVWNSAHDVQRGRRESNPHPQFKRLVRCRYVHDPITRWGQRLSTVRMMNSPSSVLSSVACASG